MPLHLRGRAAWPVLLAIFVLVAATALVFRPQPLPPTPIPQTVHAAPDPAPTPAPVPVPVPVAEPQAPPGLRPAEITPPPAAADPPVLLLDQYWNEYVGGVKNGWIRVLAYRTRKNGRPIIELHEQSQNRSRSKVASTTRESTTEMLATLEEDLSVISMDFEVQEVDRTTVTKIARDDHGYRVETELDGNKLIKRVDGDAKVCGSWDLLMMSLTRDGKLRVGEECPFLEFDLGVPRADRKVIKTVAVHEPAAGAERTIDVEFDVVKATLDSRGVIAHGWMGGTEIRAASEAEAKNFDEDAVATFSDDLNLDFTFPRYGALDEVNVRIEVAGDSEGDIFATNEYQKSSFHQEGNVGVYQVAMIPYRLREAGEHAAAETPTDFSEYLEPTPMAQCDDPSVLRKAEEITAGKTDPLDKVRAICHWINIHLAKRYTEVGDLSAKETLREMGGDCSEHAVLMEAMARAVHVPIRECSGFVFLGEVGGRHAWSQAWIDGRWQHVDAVIDTVGADPRYFLFFQHRPGRARDLTGGRRMTRLTTHPARATVESFTVFGRRWTPAEARFSANVKNHQYDNPILGLSFTLPEGWKESAKLFPLASADFRKGSTRFTVRAIPYKLESLRENPWMLGMMSPSDSWKEVPVGNRQGYRVDLHPGQRRTISWLVEFEDGTLLLQADGQAKDMGREAEGLDALLKTVVLR